MSGVLWKVGREFVPDFKVLSCSDLLQLLGLNKKGVMHWLMIQVKFVLLIMKYRTSSVQSFERACSTSMIERLRIFLL